MHSPTRLAAAVMLMSTMVLSGCSQGSDEQQEPSATGAGSCTYHQSGSAAKPVDPPSGENVADSGKLTASLTLDGAPVKLTLDREETPCTTHSFESLAKQGWFDDTRCHRLTDQGIFVLQCGDPTGTGSAGPGYTFDDELGLAKKLESVGTAADGTKLVNYRKGTVAMANAGPNTNGSQIFLVYEDSTLPPAYTVFGTMDDKSVEVLGKLAAQGVAADGTGPKAPAQIGKVTLG
ncbi:peptidylprolyl isomerase [Luteococcus sp. OSA5]|uniref:peptidylprolyl isomerase n=1 Tax=Luteococcus sp. OSA5 TaxID=3401630 RepID=UPI003B4325DE